MMPRKVFVFLLLCSGSFILLLFVFVAGCGSSHHSAMSPASPSGPGGGGGGGGSGDSGGSAQVSFSTTTYSGDNLLWNEAFGPPGIVRADLNGDGRDDFVSSGFCSSPLKGSFSVRLSTGDGAYGAPACYTIPTAPLTATTYFTAGDFFGNGKVDVAVEDEQGNLSIWKNAGDGTLTLALSMALPNGEGDVLAADINQDGKIDLVNDRGNPKLGGGTLQVLFGNGDGTFTAGPITPFNLQANAWQEAAGDFDRDGNVDVAASDANGVETGIFYGDGKGNFTPGPTFGGSDLGKTSAVFTRYQPFDINSDKITDLIGAPFTYTFCGTDCYPPGPTGKNYLDLEVGHADRTFTSQKVTLKNCTASMNPPQVADFDGDGIPDIIVAEDSDCKGDAPYTLNFLKGSGNGTFQPEQVIYSTSDEIEEYFTIEPSNSGKPGLAVYEFQDVNNTVTNEQELIMVNTSK